MQLLLLGAATEVSTTCWFHWYQPKLPEKGWPLFLWGYKMNSLRRTGRPSTNPHRREVPFG
ncbi:cyclic lactone autoinducer peptide [Thermacetogenium phaeum]|uniref:cyclic lactone autoinducer peptide n=1 Tax=Thermacetogenium phaeum TaxID=85874 RepID=UPI0009DAEA2C|nr:cyclic lactone autoinducer peptide [Thermacetogenium phaeum]